MKNTLHGKLVFGVITITLCACATNRNVPIAGVGIVMAYEIDGRVEADAAACHTPITDAPITLLDVNGTVLDETRSDASGHFFVSVHHPDAIETMVLQLDQDDPTVPVTLRVQATGYPIKTVSLRLPRPVHGKEYRVALVEKNACK